MMETLTCQILSKLYAAHSYIYDRLDMHGKEQFSYTYSSCIPIHVHALKNLSEYLNIYHGHKCIVLIDEYNHPLDVAFHNGYYEKACNFFAFLLGGLFKVGSIRLLLINKLF